MKTLFNAATTIATLIAYEAWAVADTQPSSWVPPLFSEQSCVDQWDQSMGQPGLNAGVYALEEFEGHVIAGGDFTLSGSQSLLHVASWNGSSWQPMAEGLNGTVFELSTHDGRLFAGGNFTASGSTAVSKVAEWTGTKWIPVGGGMDQEVYAFASFKGDLIVGGWFTQAGSTSVHRVARWDGLAWHEMGSVGDNPFTAFVVDDQDLYACGRYFVAKWNGRTWDQILSAPSWVAALVKFDGALVAGGQVASPVDGYIMQWDGLRWTTLGDGLNNTIAALAIRRGELIAGGNFTASGATPLSRIARWDGTTWHSLDSGTEAPVDDMVIRANGDAIIGGYFTCADGNSAGRIAAWHCGSAVACLADIVADNVVNVSDLLAVISAWGPCGSQCPRCFADIAPKRADHVVSVNDLLAVISGWGPCP